MSGFEQFLQQLIIGLSNGMIIALIALGYTMVYGIIELINFAHGDLFMLGTFLALTLLGALGLDPVTSSGGAVFGGILLMLLVCPAFCAGVNWSIDRLAYKPLRNAPKLAPLVSAIGVSFILMNLGLFWGGVPMDAFGGGRAAAAPKDFPALIPNTNLLPDIPGLEAMVRGAEVVEATGAAAAAGLRPGDRIVGINGSPTDPDGVTRQIRRLVIGSSADLEVERPGAARAALSVPVVNVQRVRFTWKELMVWSVTLPLLIGLTLFVKYTKLGVAMRATAQNPVAAQLMGVDVNRVIGATFLIGGSLAGFASVIYPLYNNTIFFQLGYRAGMDAFTAAVLGGIGNLPGAMLGGLLIGVVRSMGDQYIATMWTNTIVFAILILILVFRPSGLLGTRMREKV